MISNQKNLRITLCSPKKKEEKEKSNNFNCQIWRENTSNLQNPRYQKARYPKVPKPSRAEALGPPAARPPLRRPPDRRPAPWAIFLGRTRLVRKATYWWKKSGSPVDMVNIPLFTTGVIHPIGGWEWDFWAINSIQQNDLLTRVRFWWLALITQVSDPPLFFFESLKASV